MKRKTDNFSKFYNKKNNAAIKEAFRQEKKAEKKERKEAIERHFEEKRKAREQQFAAGGSTGPFKGKTNRPDAERSTGPADAHFKKLPGKKKPPTLAANGPAPSPGKPFTGPGKPGKPSSGNTGPASKPNVPAFKSTAPNDPNSLPLNKYIAHGGICSRRDAADLIRQGKVQVNGQLVTEPGTKVSPDDVVKFNGKPVTISRNFVYILLNKPKDYITTTDDPQGRRTVLDLIRPATTERVFPIGRLDRNTSGVLLLTNDGDLAQKLAHPKHEIKKIYHVTLDKPLVKADFDKIVTGVQLEDGLAHVDVLAYADSKDKTQIGLEIHSGRNRIVRRIFEHLGYDVRGLDRVMYAGLTKKNVQRGHWRILTEKEIRILKYLNSSFRGSLSAPKTTTTVAVDMDDEDGLGEEKVVKAPAPKKFKRPYKGASGSTKSRGSENRGSENRGPESRKPESRGSESRGPKKPRPSGAGKSAAPESPRGRKSSGSYLKSKASSQRDAAGGERKPKFRDGAAGDRKPKFRDEAPSDRKPKFRDGAAGDRKPKFRDGAASDRKPKFRDGAAGERKPKFRDGAPSDRKPKFRDGAAGDRKPKFRDAAAGDRKPAFRDKRDGAASERKSKPRDHRDAAPGARKPKSQKPFGRRPH